MQVLYEGGEDRTVNCLFPNPTRLLPSLLEAPFCFCSAVERLSVCHFTPVDFPEKMRPFSSMTTTH